MDFVFNKFTAALREYEHAGRTSEALDDLTCLIHIISIINHVVDLRQHIKSCDKVDNQGHGFVA